MQTVAASVILEDAQRLIDWDPTNLETQLVQMARNAFSLALQEVWESWWWEQLMVTKPIQFASDYAGIDGTHPSGFQYETGHPVYFPATDAYYVALWPAGPPALQPGESYATYGYNTGLPDDATPVTAVTENLYGWAKYQGCATPAPTLWNNTLTPSLGDQCRWNGNIFQWIVPQGALPNAMPDPTLVYPATTTNPGWMLLKPWQPTLPCDLQPPNLAFNGGVYLVSILGSSGPVHTIAQLDPRTTAGGKRYHQREADDASGIVALGLDVGRPWVAQRRVTPIITGDAFDGTVVYTAAAATDLVFDY